MRRSFVGIVLIVLIAVSLFAFAACNNNKASSDSGDGSSEGSWVVRVENPAGMAAEVTFTSNGLWRMFVNTGGLEEGQGQGSNDNNNWCNGNYYFDGEPGESTLYMCLYDYDAYVEATGDAGTDASNTYNPGNVRMLDANNDRIDFNVYYQAEPDANGSYEFCVELIPMAAVAEIAGIPEYARFRFDFTPPQDGTLGTDDVPQPVAPVDGLTFIDIIIIIAVVAGVVIIAAIVVIVVAVKKKKKKKAAALAEGEGAESSSADDPGESGGSAS